MSHTAIVQDTCTYHLRSEIKTEEDGEKIYFYKDYESEEDECGYSPPKYLLLDGIAKDRAEDALKELGLDSKYYIDELDWDDLFMTTVYVFDELKDIITTQELTNSRMTFFGVPIKKIIPDDEDEI